MSASVSPIVSTIPAPSAPWMLPKQCGCCGSVYTPGEWLGLRYIGLQDDADGGWLELRNCPCGSTIAVQS